MVWRSSRSGRMAFFSRTVAVAVVLACCGGAASLHAQGEVDAAVPSLTAADFDQVVGQPAGPPPTPRHTGFTALIKDLGSDVTHLPSKENLFWASVGGGLALGVHPVDDNVNEAMVNSDFAHDFFKLGKYLGQIYVLLPAAVTVYAI